MIVTNKGLRWIAVIALVSSACGSSDQVITVTGPAPPEIWFEATTRAVPQRGAPSALEVLTWIYNRTDVTLDVFVGAQCPMGVEFYLDPSMGSLSPSDACPSGQSKLSIASRDSVLLTRVVTANVLSTFAPGNYYVFVVLTGTDYVTAGPAGTVHLPLDTATISALRLRPIR